MRSSAAASKKRPPQRCSLKVVQPTYPRRPATTSIPMSMIHIMAPVLPNGTPRTMSAVKSRAVRPATINPKIHNALGIDAIPKYVNRSLAGQTDARQPARPTSTARSSPCLTEFGREGQAFTRCHRSGYNTLIGAEASGASTSAIRWRTLWANSPTACDARTGRPRRSTRKEV